eukprot:g7748.t1
MLCARLLCLAAVAAAAAAADMPKLTLKESGENGESCDLTKVGAQLAMTSSCDVKTTVVGSGKTISLKEVSAKVDTTASALSALAGGVNKMKCDSVGLEGTRFGEGSGCACPACQNGGNLPTQVIDGNNPCQCLCNTLLYTGEQCQTKVACDNVKDCNGRATAVSGDVVDGCTCTCIAEADNSWRGDACEKCGPAVADATEEDPTRLIDGNGQCDACPNGYDCNGGTETSDSKECFADAPCENESTCYDSHTEGENKQAIGAYKCVCTDNYEGTNCQTPKLCGTKQQAMVGAEPLPLPVCATTHTYVPDDGPYKGTTLTATGAGNWDKASNVIDGCKCDQCAQGWGHKVDEATQLPSKLCDKPTMCTIEDDCGSDGTKAAYGFAGQWTNAEGTVYNGCKCECKEHYSGTTCETYDEPGERTWEWRTSGNCPEGALVNTAAECTAAYASVAGGEDDVAPMIDRSATYTSDPSGCHVGYKGQLSMWKSDCSGPCSNTRKCLCRTDTGKSGDDHKYGVFSADASKVVKYWTREDTTQCTPILTASECTTVLNEGSTMLGGTAGAEGKYSDDYSFTVTVTHG